MALAQLEKSLEGIFIKSAPKLPEGGKTMIVAWLPWLALVGGLCTLLAAWWVWDWAHVASNLADYANTLSRSLGGGDVVGDRLTAGIWLGLIVLVVQAVIYLAAFPAVKARQKRGWDLLLLGLLVNVLYGVVVLFTDYGGFGTFLGSLLGSVIGLWLLFQIRDKYHGSRTPVA